MLGEWKLNPPQSQHLGFDQRGQLRRKEGLSLLVVHTQKRKPKNFPTSGSHSTKPSPCALGCCLVMLWLHLQPAEGSLPRGFSLSNSRACTAISANQALSPRLCIFIQRRPGTTLEVLFQAASTTAAVQIILEPFQPKLVWSSVLNHCLL